jgi:hypothetical protein
LIVYYLRIDSCPNDAAAGHSLADSDHLWLDLELELPPSSGNPVEESVKETLTFSL